MRQTLFEIPLFGGIPIYGYGTMVLVGVLAGLWLLGRNAKRHGLDPKGIQDLAVFVVFSGLLGGRLFYFVQFRNDYEGDLLAFFRLWEGGLVLYGGIFGGALCLVLLCLKQKRSILFTLDLLIPSVALGVAFGRIGCLLNGCCWGQVCRPDFPLGVTFPAGSPPAADLVSGGGALGASLPVHPTQLYASVNALLLTWVLWWVGRHKSSPGKVIGTAALLYGLSRFALEGMRGDHQPEPGSWTVSQWICALVVLLGVAFLVVARRRGGQPPSALGEPSTAPTASG